MANLARIRTVWSGAQVTGAGVSTWYWDEADVGFIESIDAFWAAVRNLIPIGVGLTTPSSGDLLDVASGKITGTWNDGIPSLVTGNGTGTFAAGVGARVRWDTTGIKNGRRIRGSTFIVPLVTSVYDSDGSISPGALSVLQTAVSQLATNAAGNLRVWSRPKAGSGGQQSGVLSGFVPDTVSWLRSRRT